MSDQTLQVHIIPNQEVPTQLDTSQKAENFRQLKLTEASSVTSKLSRISPNKRKVDHMLTLSPWGRKRAS